MENKKEIYYLKLTVVLLKKYSLANEFFGLKSYIEKKFWTKFSIKKIGKLLEWGII